jgi:TRAP-type C4-dicarboxylate transport system substrate-binding protein
VSTRTAVAIVVGALAATGLAPRAEADQKVLKIATLAPEGSSWMKLFHEWGSNLEKKSNGAIKVKFYAGGVAGDERDAVRKMRLGQINGAAVTAVGLGLIQPEVRVLELPFLFNNYDEMDFVRNTLDARFRKLFEEKGYELLGWGDVGPIQIFTNVAVRSKADILQTKLWAWVDDPVVRTLFQELGLNGVPLGVPDVLPSLQTGMINACYGSPLSVLALQWHSKVRFVTSMTISQSVGAVVLTKKAWDELGPDQQKLVLDESRELQAKLLKQVRADNTAALDKMKSLGIQVIDTPAAVSGEFASAGHSTAVKLDGQLYTKEFRAEVEKLVEKKRGGH